MRYESEQWSRNVCEGCISRSSLTDEVTWCSDVVSRLSNCDLKMRCDAITLFFSPEAGVSSLEYSGETLVLPSRIKQRRLR